MRLIDISPPISDRIAVFPMDVPFRREVSLAFAEGDHLELSAIRSTVHVGAHADAPCHYSPGAPSISERPLDLYYGPCQVIEVRVAPGARVLPSDLPVEIRAPRLLLKTGSWPDPEVFNPDFASYSPALLEHAHARGVVLAGIDTPSMDPADSKDLPAHAVLAKHDMANLEGLDLGHVPAGLYTLVAFPLRLEGADGSPVRAVLVAD